MKRVLPLIALLICSPLSSSSVVAEDKYQASAGMSYIIFKIRHFGVTNAYGRFNAFSGEIERDNAKFNFEANAGSIDTGIEARDEHLRGPDFFNAAEFPKITFKSTSAKKTDENNYEITGDLTLLGVTKSVTAKVRDYGKGKHPKGHPIMGCEVVFNIKRSDFGMKYGLPDAIGDNVELTVSLMGEQK